MEFVHRPYDPQATIAAIATPPGEGGVAIIRISGRDALDVASRVFSGKIHSYASHTAHYGKFFNRRQEVIDSGLALVMHAPRSYTGEPTVELHCHGGALISRRVLEAAIEAGARTAEPGEFTFRAFMNGKLDLPQAEAVQSVISARNELALSSAEKQLEGALSKKILSFQEALVDSAATLEAWVDFPEEGLEFTTMDLIIQQLAATLQEMHHLEATFHQGRFIQEGFSLCLVGRPNAGKSSLMNALLGYERAIVTSIPGTTRDLLQEDLRLGTLHFRLCDTAGIRETEETIEQEGIRRSKKAMEEADLVLLVIDAQHCHQREERVLIEKTLSHKTILAWNKVDLQHPPLPSFDGYKSVSVSAKKGWGLSELQQAIEQLIWQKGPPSKEEVVITNVRHKEALGRACHYLDQLIEGLKQEISPEFLASDMRSCLQELGTIIGTNITEDILTAIFSKFCVGK
jgi:tRNA modification GTPase